MADTHGAYPLVMRSVAREMNVPFIEGKQDNTHFVETGATAMARLAVEGLREHKLALVNFLKE